MATNIKNRLIVGATTQEPTTAMIELWLREAYKYAMGVIPCVKETTVAVATGHSVTLDADEVYYVSVGWQPLLPSEWQKQGDTLKLSPAAAAIGDTVQVWYYLKPVIDTASTLTIDSSCIFGPDWLEEVVMQFVEGMIETRMANTAGSADASGHAGMMRSFQEEWKALLTPQQVRFNEWKQARENAILARINFGDRQLKESPHAAFRNRSRIVHRNAGVG